jgi:tetratricopeptide (TPR) repeat protein
MEKKMVLNPVEYRLLDLASHWETFRENASKRLLVWQTDDNALRFFQCFFEAQKHETDYTVGDLFVVFDVPFQNTIQYSRALKESLAGQYEASREDLTQQGISPDWQFDPEQTPDSASGFVQSLSSFDSKHRENIGHLVAVFMPSEVANDDAFASWLTRVLVARIPEQLRFVVIDSLETPRLNQLIGSKHELIHVDTPKIDALTTAQETFAQESAVGPAAVFRNLLMGLMTLVEKGSAKQVKTKATDAIKFARKEKWADQEVVITMLVAGALLKEKRFDEAVKEYKTARQAAKEATAEGHPSGQQLTLQTLFGEAGVHLAAGDLAKAVECYDEAAALASQIPDIILGVEAFRMGTFCLARMNEFKPAIDRGMSALTLGEQLEPDMRPMTSLPIAAVDLLRVIEPKRVEQMEHIKYHQNKQMDELRKKAEQRAAELEQSTQIQPFREIEKDLDQEIAKAEKSASQQIDSLYTSGSESFQQVFIRSRDLIGTTWPLGNLTPLPEEADTTGDVAS